MRQSIAQVALVVRDYDEAIAFFTEKLAFRLVEDLYQPVQDIRGPLRESLGSHSVCRDAARSSSSTLLRPSVSVGRRRGQSPEHSYPPARPLGRAFHHVGGPRG